MKNFFLCYVLVGCICVDVYNKTGMCFTELPHKNEDHKPDTVTVTMYNAVTEQTDSTPTITASGKVIDTLNATRQHYIALSRNLLVKYGGRYDFGDKVYIKTGCKKTGIYTVVDVMNPRWVNKVDILETKGSPLYKFEKSIIYKL